MYHLRTGQSSLCVDETSLRWKTPLFFFINSHGHTMFHLICIIHWRCPDHLDLPCLITRVPGSCASALFIYESDRFLCLWLAYFPECLVPVPLPCLINRVPGSCPNNSPICVSSLSTRPVSTPTSVVLSTLHATPLLAKTHCHVSDSSSHCSYILCFEMWRLTVFKYDTALLMYEVTLKYICRYQCGLIDSVGHFIFLIKPSFKTLV